MKEIYRKLCESEPSIPLFSQAWWLDAVAGDQWDVVLATKKQQVIGALPYVLRKRRGFRLLSQPILTQTLGPWVRPTHKSYPKQLAYEKDVLGELADQLPNYDHYAQNWHCDRQNWLPFYWRGFKQTTRYTYRLDLKADKEQLWKGMQQNIRSDIRKAKDRVGVDVREGTLEEFMALNRMVFKRQNRTVPYTSKLVSGLDTAVSARNARDCLVAVDREGNLHAGAYIVRGGNTAYYLMGGGNPELRNSGATSLVLWEAICRQPETVEVFDFEGSMIEPIERFFRAFGAIQTPYFHVSRSNSKLFKLLITLRPQRS
ncbi:GNAT family N-acetyltransferase [Billgrantia gudaonensis]|uniref:Acetyltransferase involved in cellulose biosynthesis, CelD/BcsL family n=1 Tax=Billgrantia gudaonensis TaxID=376427 RepID=A0A1G8R0G8_9GAMM|nr:GNAT family N-acetyltransferase [Halomonas gudaonensis]SDJ09900.1 Acetyltransferase involved in cellulose biosynthesis, CelD/BcsL family [Halomonas gudaonensis]